MSSSLQLEHHIHEFRMSQDQLAEVRERYKQGSSSVNDLARELAQVSTHMLTESIYNGACTHTHTENYNGGCM